MDLVVITKNQEKEGHYKNMRACRNSPLSLYLLGPPPCIPLSRSYLLLIHNCPPLYPLRSLHTLPDHLPASAPVARSLLCPNLPSSYFQGHHSSGPRSFLFGQQRQLQIHILSHGQPLHCCLWLRFLLLTMLPGTKSQSHNHFPWKLAGTVLPYQNLWGWQAWKPLLKMSSDAQLSIFHFSISLCLEFYQSWPNFGKQGPYLV